MKTDSYSYIVEIFEKSDQKTIIECYQNVTSLLGQDTELTEEKKKRIAIDLYSLIK